MERVIRAFAGQVDGSKVVYGLDELFFVSDRDDRVWTVVLRTEVTSDHSGLRLRGTLWSSPSKSISESNQLSNQGFSAQILEEKFFFYSTLNSYSTYQ
ncbi:hypothetical protein HYC85_014831 [Camellia sinensis]|uniref:Uncharacterized protein n=1 Tax=Camellia sinensis TaxID=4442 RepID=A0A7J7HAH3_CAMSI|nr:hypothetical protein HYC85_014831 [Camellia sinensis]